MGILTNIIWKGEIEMKSFFLKKKLGLGLFFLFCK